eukprot:jgi/Chrzof1/1196/Cz01g44100.t1
MATRLFREVDALAYRPADTPSDRQPANYIAKAHKRNKGEEVVFDPKGHREFLTGFRKRKQQRRKEAVKQLEQKQKKQRTHDRAERRAKMKEELHLPEDYGVGSNSSDEEPAQDAAGLNQHADVKVYAQGAVTTTVSVLNLHPDSDDNSSSSSAHSDDDDDDNGTQQPGRHPAAHNSKGQANGKHTGNKQRSNSQKHHKPHNSSTGGAGVDGGGGIRKVKKMMRAGSSSSGGLGRRSKGRS